jgi:GNAT superfamily N-acetyltransferase
MNIRQAIEKDVTRVRNLVSSLSHFYLKDKTIELPTWFSDTRTDSAFLFRFQNVEFTNFVCELEGEIVGYISFKGNSHLYHLFVAETHQGKGLSKRLWAHAITYCISDRYSLRSSIYAIPVYQKLGFRTVGDAGEKDGIGFQSMELNLKS